MTPCFPIAEYNLAKAIGTRGFLNNSFIHSFIFIQFGDIEKLVSFVGFRVFLILIFL